MSMTDLEQRGEEKLGYILVDFDRTLAQYNSWKDNGKSLGGPIGANVERVKRWLSGGYTVKIFTARAAKNNPFYERDCEAIVDWCIENLSAVLEITNEKDFGCIGILDDLAMAVEPNTGLMLHNHPMDPLEEMEELELVTQG